MVELQWLIGKWFFTLADDDPSLPPLLWQQNYENGAYGILGVGPSGRPPRLQIADKLKES